MTDLFTAAVDVDGCSKGFSDTGWIFSVFLSGSGHQFCLQH